jgi:hypothetical protein
VLSVAAKVAGDEAAKIALRINDKEISTHEIKTEYTDAKKEWQTLEQTVTLQGDSKLSIRFLNSFADAANPDPNKRERNVAIGQVQVQGP